MTLDDLMQDSYSRKLLQGLVGMLARDYQSRALDMTSEELYENSEFFPIYNPDKHDYSTKSVGYTCRTSDGTIMQLMDGSAYAASTLEEGGESGSQIPVIWHRVWSNDPRLAKPFDASELSPYSAGNCCFFNGKVYRSLKDNNTSSPDDDPNSWEDLGFEF